jgi:ribosomal-protein-serine acetyltransferase
MGAELNTQFHIGDDLILRMFRDSDAEAVFVVVKRNYDHLKPFMHWATPGYSIQSAREFIEKSIESTVARTGLGFGIFEKHRFIGSIGFVKFDWNARKTEIGYWIDQDEEGRGIISAACRVLIEYAFVELHLNRVEIRCAASNLRSAAIPERLGFRNEGVLRRSEFRDGRLQDFKIFGLLADEWDLLRLKE